MFSKRKYNDDDGNELKIVLGHDKVSVDVGELVRFCQSQFIDIRRTVLHEEERKVQWDFSEIWRINGSDTIVDDGYLIHYSGLDLGLTDKNKQKFDSAALSTSCAVPIISTLLRMDSRLDKLWKAAETCEKFWMLERVSGPLRIHLDQSASGCRENLKLVSIPPSVEYDAIKNKSTSSTDKVCTQISVKVDLLVLGCDELIRLGLPAVLELDTQVETETNQNYNYNFRSRFNEKVRTLAAVNLLRRVGSVKSLNQSTSKISELIVSPQNFTLFLDHDCQQSDGFYYATLRRRNCTIDLI